MEVEQLNERIAQLSELVKSMEATLKAVEEERNRLVVQQKEIKKQCCNTLNRINELEKEWDNIQAKPINLSKIWNGVDPTLKDELMIDDDGIMYPF